MKKIKLGDIDFTIHNQREDLFIGDVKRDIETMTKYISNPNESLSEFNEADRQDVIDFKLTVLHGKLLACYWMDIIKSCCGLYCTDDFKRHFMDA